jgi:S1-C subfamily serine protease
MPAVGDTAGGPVEQGETATTWFAGYSGAPAPWATGPTPAVTNAPAHAAPRPPRRSRRAIGIAAGLVGLVVASGAAGAAIGIHVDRPTAPAARTSGHQTQKATASLDVSAIAAKVDPAVVDITTQLGAGTGMILTPTGEVLTNNHVVSGATDITARIDGKGRTYRVEVLGVDPPADVALVQLIGASGLPTVHLGTSTGLLIGDQVVAIGNALDLSGPPTVTQGIVSALGRSISANDPTGPSEDLSGLIQTDAPINPGNSGGPLVNAAAQVIGMNTAAANGSAAQSATDIGFAIPVDTAAAIVRQIQSGRAGPAIVLGEHGLIGVEVLTVAEADGPNGLAGTPAFYYSGYTAPVKSGAVVAEVGPDLPAAGAGIQVGDVIVSFAGHPVATPVQLTQLIDRYHPYDRVPLAWVDPSGRRHSGAVTLAISPVK